VDGGVFVGADQCLAGVLVSAATHLQQQPAAAGDVWEPVVVCAVGEFGAAPREGSAGLDNALRWDGGLQGRRTLAEVFRNFDGNWRARISANRVNIIHADGEANA
jgi:hypothetical protein